MKIWAPCLVTLCLLVCYTQAATPAFLQAISSALGSIPFGSFPLSMTGFSGAKLAVGGKLLYYLGLFGGRGSPKPASTVSKGNQFSGGFSQNQFMTGGPGFMSGHQGMPGGFAHQPLANAPKPPPDPMVLMQALTEQGINPLQLMQALSSAGVDPAQMLQAMMSGGPGNRAGQTGISSGAAGMPPTGSPGGMAGGRLPSQMGSSSLDGRPQFLTSSGGSGFNSNLPPQSKPKPGGSSMPHDFSDTLPPSPEHNVREESATSEEGSEEDVESFFEFLKDMDDNKCISRLICDIGTDPDFLGEFTRNIDTIINTLEVPSGSGAQEYMRILEHGRTVGGCEEKFTECDEDAYEIVKSVAPSVGVPGLSPGGNQL